MRLVPASLRARLAVLFGAGTLLVLLLALSLLYLALDRQLAGAVDVALAGRSDDLMAGVRAQDLTAVAGDPMAQLYDSAGTPIATSVSIAGRVLLSPAQAREVRGTTVSSRTLPLGTDGAPLRVRLRSQPVGRTGQVLTVALPTAAVEDAGDRQLIVLAVAAPLLIALLAGLGWLLLRAALRPVDLLTREAAAISTLDSDRRLPVVRGDDEIARLAATLDGMLARLSVAFARERAFVDDAGHELRTPSPCCAARSTWRWVPSTIRTRSGSHCWPPRARSPGWSGSPRTCCCWPGNAPAPWSCTAFRSTSPTWRSRRPSSSPR
ncbi:HAMP domain-containing protein [Paractinoplanes durhamensis]|uniref:HAMP domain-containing protein n=1 Tax=Paractinoplanes durhamensis TaxID=113563 RepID=UPI003628B490